MTTSPAAARPLSRSGYPIGSPSRVCAATGRPISTGEPYIAALVQVIGPQGEEYRRVDLSLEAWQSGARPRANFEGGDGRPLPVFGSWRGVMPEPGAKRRILIDDESLLDLFEQSGDEGGVAGEPTTTVEGAAAPTPDDRRTFRFMLALILLRKKLLVCERSDKDGTMFVRPRGAPKASEGGVLSPVEDPRLGEASIARVVGQLTALLDGETPGTPATPGASA